MPNNHIGKTVDAVKFAEQLDRSEEFAIRGRFRVTTLSGSVYTVDDDAKTIQKNEGPPVVYPGRVAGTTFGGSMLMPGRLLPGGLMEFVLYEPSPRRCTSSPIVTVEEIA